MAFRELTSFERAVLARLLEEPFPGRDELRLQALTATAEPFPDEDNYGSVQLLVSGPEAFVNQRVPVEGRAFDDDGVYIDYLLHVINGYMNELEVVKADLSAIQTFPDPSELDVFRRS